MSEHAHNQCTWQLEKRELTRCTGVITASDFYEPDVWDLQLHQTKCVPGGTRVGSAAAPREAKVWGYIGPRPGQLLLIFVPAAGAKIKASSPRDPTRYLSHQSEPWPDPP